MLKEAGAIAQQGLIADAVVSHDALGGLAGLYTAPLVLEAAFQAAGLHRMAVDGERALPASIEEVQLLHVPDDQAALGLMVQRRGDAETGGAIYDVDVDGPQGAVLRLRGFRMVDTGPLDDGQRFKAPDGDWPVVVVAKAVQRSGPSRTSSLLHPEEVAEILARGNASRQRDRFAGRLAGRRAVAALLGPAGVPFVLRSAPSGAPWVDVHGGVAPRVSITHRDGLAFAVACHRGHPGIDRERPALRSPAFMNTWFHAAERAWSDGDAWRQTALWCIKEAVLKSLGTGMQISPRNICVEGLRGRHVQVRLHGEAHQRWQDLGGGAWCITIGTWDGDVVAASMLTESSVQPLFSAIGASTAQQTA